MADVRLDETEAEAMAHMTAVHGLILSWGLRANYDELATAIHMIQGFIMQHMLQRLAPDEFGHWYRMNDQHRE